MNTEHRTQNTEHRTQNTEHRTQNTEHRTQNTGTQHEASIDPQPTRTTRLWSHGAALSSSLISPKRSSRPPKPICLSASPVPSIPMGLLFLLLPLVQPPSPFLHQARISTPAAPLIFMNYLQVLHLEHFQAFPASPMSPVMLSAFLEVIIRSSFPEIIPAKRHYPPQ